jgi:hypothetical protein
MNGADDPLVLFHFDTANSTLYFSPDGTTGSATALAQVQSGVTLGPADICIVGWLQLPPKQVGATRRGPRPLHSRPRQVANRVLAFARIA